MKKEKELTVRELVELCRRYRRRGMKPYLKGSKGSVKIQFED